MREKALIIAISLILALIILFSDGGKKIDRNEIIINGVIRQSLIMR